MSVIGAELKEKCKKPPTSVVYIQTTIPRRPSLVGSPPVAEISRWNVPPGTADCSLAPMARKPMTSSFSARSRWILAQRADAILTWVCCAWQTDDRILCGGLRLKVMQTLRLRADRPIIAQPFSIRGGQHPRSRDVIEDERHGCVMGKRGLAEKGIASTRAVAEEIASMLQLLPQNLRDCVDIIITGSR